MNATKTFRSGRLTVVFTKVETRGVLAGAYRGKDVEERITHTHMVFMLEDREVRTGCKQDLDHVADHYSGTDEDLALRPTCPTCAAKWDKIHA